MGRRLGLLLLLSLLFFIGYSACGWITAQRAPVPVIMFGWEAAVPFLPWTILPYWTTDLFFALSFLLCPAALLYRHAARLALVQIGAYTGFLLWPLSLARVRPPTEGLPGVLFDLLGGFDRPYNQMPSLHVALTIALWPVFARALPAFGRWLWAGWSLLVIASTLTTWQHQAIDLPTGAVLGLIVLWLLPDDGPSPLAAAQLTHDPARRRLALAYGAGALICLGLAGFGGWALWLLWPGLALGLVALAYLLLGPALFQKRSDGRMAVPVRLLLAPYLAAARLNARLLWRPRQGMPAAVTPDVRFGRQPGRAAGAVLDLTAELPGGVAPVWNSLPWLDLVPPTPAQLAAAADRIETLRRHPGGVHVCCALGLGRSAAAVAAWLVIHGGARDVGAAIQRIYEVEPRAVIGSATAAALAALAPGP